LRLAVAACCEAWLCLAVKSRIGTGLRHLIWPADAKLAQLEIKRGRSPSTKVLAKARQSHASQQLASRIENLAKKTRSRWFVPQIGFAQKVRYHLL